MRDGDERLLDMLEAIEDIERYAVRGREAFLRDELVQVWMVHHLQIIGEAAARPRRPEVFSRSAPSGASRSLLTFDALLPIFRGSR
ncbi:HepT-like ribonuclease domain-containing protein [Methanoculleus sp.]|uniref:HepT-like ribonuclease domain-containing protein n=1 Tax=Methanoculleus sp. TaxID=90427 RepID=UPI0025FA7116|nr:HepT-like ribonuclease domain-containing protein [Methanoculleus sp.]